MTGAAALARPYHPRRARALPLIVGLAAALLMAVGSAACGPLPTAPPLPTVTPLPTATPTPTAPQLVGHVVVRTLRWGTALTVAALVAAAVLLWRYPGQRPRARELVSRQVARHRIRWAQRLGQGMQTGETYGVTLSPERQKVAARIRHSATRLERDVAVLPYASVKADAKTLLQRLRQLVPAAESSLYLAQWLQEEIDDLKATADGETELEQDRLDHIQHQLAAIDALGQRIGDMLRDAHISLLDNIVDQDRKEDLIRDQITALADGFARQHEAVRKINEAVKAP